MPRGLSDSNCHPRCAMPVLWVLLGGRSASPAFGNPEQHPGTARGRLRAGFAFLLGGHWGHGRATRGPCGARACPYGPVGTTPTGHSWHGAMCPFGRYWSFGLLVLGGDREVTSLSSAASTEATAERKAERAQDFLQHNLWCRVFRLLSIEMTRDTAVDNNTRSSHHGAYLHQPTLRDLLSCRPFAPRLPSRAVLTSRGRDGRLVS